MRWVLAAAALTAVVAGCGSGGASGPEQSDRPPERLTVTSGGMSLPACLRASTSATLIVDVRSMKPNCSIHASL